MTVAQFYDAATRQPSIVGMSASEALGRVPAAFRGVAFQIDSAMVGMPCACGEYVWALPTSPTAGVAAHNAGRSHEDWWRRVQLEWQGIE